jgi:hypothetical protein
MCVECGLKTSATAGTIFHRSHTPLSTWFAAIWFVTSQKNGVSAPVLQDALGFGSYETAWAWLHKLRAPWYDRNESGSAVLSNSTRASWAAAATARRAGNREGGVTCSSVKRLALKRRFGRGRLLERRHLRGGA